MKYTMFRNLVVGGVVAAVGVSAYALLSGPRSVEPPPPTRAPAPAPAPPPPVPDREPLATPPVAVEASTDRQPLRPIDGKILARLATSLGSDKVKDAWKTEAIKVNLYQDAGKALPNRVKLDLDRDDKFDERWTVDGPKISREISSTDDDKTYDQRWLLAGDSWEREGGARDAPAPPAAAPQAPPAGDALRPVDGDALALARAGISGDKVKDATAGKPYKVSLYHDAGTTGVNRLKLDLDRDEKWDEKWTFDGEEVKRQVAPADDEQYTVEYRLRAGRWVKK